MRVVLGDVCGVAGDLVGDHALLHIILVRQAEVFLRGHVAQHSGAVTTDLGGADGGGDVVVTRSGIGGQRSQGVERSVVLLTGDRLVEGDVRLSIPSQQM